MSIVNILEKSDFCFIEPIAGCSFYHLTLAEGLARTDAKEALELRSNYGGTRFTSKWGKETLHHRYMSVMASQITANSTVYSTVYEGFHQSNVVDSPHKGPVTWKVSPCHDVIMDAKEALEFTINSHGTRFTSKLGKETQQYGNRVCSVYKWMGYVVWHLWLRPLAWAHFLSLALSELTPSERQKMGPGVLS